jgi:hypothetical protein
MRRRSHVDDPREEPLTDREFFAARRCGYPWVFRSEESEPFTLGADP